MDKPIIYGNSGIFSFRKSMKITKSVFLGQNSGRTWWRQANFLVSRGEGGRGGSLAEILLLAEQVNSKIVVGSHEVER